MAGPWEAYQQQTPAAPAAAPGPWDAYSQQQAARVEQTGTNSVGRWDSFTTGLGDVPRGAAQLMQRVAPSGSLMDQLTTGIDPHIQQREQEYQAGRQTAGRTGTDWWRMGGQAAAGLPLAAVAAPTSVGGAILAGGATGAAMGAAQPVTEGDDYWWQKAGQVGLSAVGGAVAGPAGVLLGRAISPRVSPEVAALHGEGVRMTPGQILGGAWRNMEDKAMSFPLVGDAIRGARVQSVADLNRAAANRVLEPFGESLPEGAPVGREMVAGLQQRVNQAYDAARAASNPFGPDPQFLQAVQQQIASLNTPAQQKAFLDAFQNHLMPLLRGGQITPDTWKTIDSSLGQMARDLAGSTDALQKHAAPAYRALQDSLRDLMVRQNPQAAPLFRQADQAAAGLMIVENAAHSPAAMGGSIPGVFSPAQLSIAVKQGDSTVRNRAFAAGNARMQDLSDAGRAVLPAEIPNSGTTDRAALALLWV